MIAAILQKPGDEANVLPDSQIGFQGIGSSWDHEMDAANRYLADEYNQVSTPSSCIHP